MQTRAPILHIPQIPQDPGTMFPGSDPVPGCRDELPQDHSGFCDKGIARNLHCPKSARGSGVVVFARGKQHFSFVLIIIDELIDREGCNSSPIPKKSQLPTSRRNCSIVTDCKLILHISNKSN